jgi:hypothetical protein
MIHEWIYIGAFKYQDEELYPQDIIERRRQL